MSLLMQVEQESRIHAGEVYEVGETVRLPNALALALKKKGFATHASGEAHAKEAAAKVAARAAKRKKEKR